MQYLLFPGTQQVQLLWVFGCCKKEFSTSQLVAHQAKGKYFSIVTDFRKSVDLSGDQPKPQLSFYVIGGILVLGFFNFAMSMRNFLHVDFMINMREVSADILKEIGLPDHSNYKFKVIPEKEAILPPDIDFWRLQHISSAHRLMARAVVLLSSYQLMF